MYNVLLALHLIITLSLIGIILVQRSSSDGLGGMGGGGRGMGGLLTSRGQANLLTRTTAILAALFILNSLALSWLTQQGSVSRSIADKVVEQEKALEVPAPESVKTKAAEVAPAAEDKAESKADKKATDAVSNVKAKAKDGIADKAPVSVPQPQ